MRSPLMLAALLAASSAAADSISFEEIPAHNSNRVALSEEYAHLGIHFVTTDDGAIWDGLSNGDPGGWELEGTHGPSFLGFNGRSYALRVLFDVPVPAFLVDVASSGGADPDTVFTLDGYRDGVLIDSATVVLGAVNEWFTAGLEAEVDEVVLRGQTQGYRPYGADNLRWGGLDTAPARLDVAIDVRPGSSENPIHPGSRGVVPVAVLGSPEFDVAEVDPGTLLLGVDGAPAEPRSLHEEDVNGDGWPDLVGHYRVSQTGTAYGDRSICLTAATYEGQELAGCDAILTVPGSQSSAHKAR